MKKVQRIIAGLLVAAGLGTLGFAATRPQTYTVVAYCAKGEPLTLHRDTLIEAEHLAFSLVDDTRDFQVTSVNIVDSNNQLVDVVQNTTLN